MYYPGQFLLQIGLVDLSNKARKEYQTDDFKSLDTSAICRAGDAITTYSTSASGLNAIVYKLDRRDAKTILAMPKAGGSTITPALKFSNGKMQLYKPDSFDYLEKPGIQR